MFNNKRLEKLEDIILGRKLFSCGVNLGSRLHSESLDSKIGDVSHAMYNHIGQIKREIDEIRREHQKLKAIVAELTNYTYGDK